MLTIGSAIQSNNKLIDSSLPSLEKLDIYNVLKNNRCINVIALYCTTNCLSLNYKLQNYR